MIKFYSDIMGSEPLMTDAGRFGIVSRKRLWWGSDQFGRNMWDLDELLLPENVGLHRRTKHPKCMEITWSGKPVPAKWHLKAGYQLAFEPADVVRALGRGALHTFTREFQHPGDHSQEVSVAAIEASGWMGCGSQKAPTNHAAGRRRALTGACRKPVSDWSPWVARGLFERSWRT